MPATLFGVPASHPTLAAALMLEHKGIDYRRIDFAPAVHRVGLRLVGFRGRTVPALRLDGRRLQGSRRIARALEQLRPEPPLFPSDLDRRAAVERAEEWGDEVLQPLARRLAWAALRRAHSTIGSFLEDARLGIPNGVAERTAAPLVYLSASLNGASDEAARADLAALPAYLPVGPRPYGATEPSWKQRPPSGSPPSPPPVSGSRSATSPSRTRPPRA